MGAILNNHDAEALILDVRAGRQAARAAIEGSGTFLVFPTAVVVDRDGTGQLVFPLRLDQEPGSLCRHAGCGTVAATVDGIEVEGRFEWSLTNGPGDSHPSPAAYRFRSGGHEVPTPSWACQLPRSISLPRLTAARLLRAQTRLVRQGRLAEHWLLVLSQQVLEACCRGPLRRVLATHGLVQDTDLVQRGLQVASRLLGVYASPRRPPRSWLGMLQLDAKRDMHREVSQLDWLPRELSEVVDRARSAGIGLSLDPTVTLSALLDASLDAGQPLPRVSARQVQAALAAPELRSLDAPSGPRPGWRAGQAGISEPDPALEAVDDQRGHAAAAIARLVTDDRETIVQAFLGDPAAIKAVADRVTAALRHPGERPTATRRRWRNQFLATGALLSVAGVAERLAHGADGNLTALDAALGSAVDFDIDGRGVAGG